MDYQQSYQPNIGNLPSSTASEKTLLWSQPYIDSGYNTSAPSISSIDAFLNEEQMDTNIQPVPLMPQPQQQQQPRPDWNFQNNKMAPIIENPQLMPINNQIAPSASQNITLLQPTDLQQKKHCPPPIPQQQQAPVESDNALQNWMNSQDNNEATLKAIPELIKLLNDEDLVVVGQAAMLVNQMSKKQHSCLALIETPDCLVSLVNCLANDRNIETAKHVVATFYNISMYPKGIQSIINSNAIQALVNLLSVPMETVVSYAITTLHNVLLACGDIKAQLRKLGGIQKMVPLLTRHKNAKFLAIVVDCLQLLSHCHQESKLLLLEYGCPNLLIEILRTSNYPKLILMTMRLLKVLSVCSQNKKALISCGAMQVLSLHLTNGNHNELQNCLITIRNLSDAATKINGLEGLIENLIKLISSSNEGISTLAAGILSNLTCNNEMNKIAVLKFNGIPILINVIEKSFNKCDLTEPCICTLRHITNRHKDALQAQEEMKRYNGVLLLTNLLNIKPYNWSIVKATLGVLRNFASNAANLQYLRNLKIIETTMQVMFDSYNESSQKQVVNEVNLIDIVDASSNIVLFLMKDYNNQIHIKNINAIPFFIQLLNTQNEKIQHIAGSLLAELAQNRECIVVIDHPGVHFYLNRALSRPDGIVDNNAKTILYHLNEYKYMPNEQANWNAQQHMPGPPQQQIMPSQYDIFEQQQQQQLMHQQQMYQQQQQQPSNLQYNDFTQL